MIIPVSVRHEKESRKRQFRSGHLVDIRRPHPHSGQWTGAKDSIRYDARQLGDAK